MDREQVARVSRIRLYLLPHACDVDVDRSSRRHCVVTPHLIQKPMARQGYITVLDEVAQ
jgi:hypothetical protein